MTTTTEYPLGSVEFVRAVVTVEDGPDAVDLDDLTDVELRIGGDGADWLTGAWTDAASARTLPDGTPVHDRPCRTNAAVTLDAPDYPPGGYTLYVRPDADTEAPIIKAGTVVVAG